MMSIGEFARAVNLSVSAVRFYADRGLLPPAATDATTGYRYYNPSQVPVGSLIRDLRLMEVPLSEIERMLHLDGPSREAELTAHLQRLENRLAGVRSLARTLSSSTSNQHATMVEARDLAHAIVQVVAAAGTDPRQPHHMCVLIEVRDGSLRCVATDSYRLAVRDLVGTNVGLGFSAVVAAAEVQHWPEALQSAGELTVRLDSETLTVDGDDLDLHCATVPIDFPDYEPVLTSSTNVTTTVITSQQDLMSALESFGGDASVSLAASGGALTIAREETERRIAAQVDGAETTVALNPRFVVDAIEHTLGSEVTIEIDDRLRPVTFRSADDGTFTSRLMPVRPTEECNTSSTMAGPNTQVIICECGAPQVVTSSQDIDTTDPLLAWLQHRVWGADAPGFAFELVLLQALLHNRDHGGLMTDPTPARRLVEAFGDNDTMAAMYTDDITWRLNHSLAANVAGPHVGKDAVTGFNRAVFGKFYDPSSVSVAIHDELGDESSSVVRFDMHATSSRGHSYDVEYVLFAKARDGSIYEVVELLDTHASNEQHQGNPVGVPPS